MAKQISRRDFLKGTAAGALGAAAAGLFSGLSISAEEAEALYIPGTYTAVAQGMGEITVTMTFSATQITDIQVDTSNETEGIGLEQGDVLGQQILDAQSSEIDGISGASVTSDAVREAADSCINQALILKPEATDPTEEKTWRDAPDPVSADQITATYDCDILVVGMGYAGITALRAAAEAGADVIGLECRTKEDHWCVGHDIGHINSQALAKFGVPEVDEVEFVNNWQLMTHGKSNPALIMKFAKNSGDAIDWVLEAVPEEITEKMDVSFWPETENVIHQLNTGFRYYPGTLQLWEYQWNNKGAKGNNTEELELKDVMAANLDYVAEHYPNAAVQYGVHGEYLLKEDGAVVGLVALDTDDNYIQYNAKKVILSTGGFGGNSEMCEDLLSFIKNMQSSEETSIGSSKCRDGSGHKMGVWAGGRLESEISSMNFDSSAGPDKFSTLLLDENAERYCNECFAGPEINGFLNARLKRRMLISLFDANIDEQLTYSINGHGSFEPQKQYNFDNLHESLEAAYAAGAESDNDYFAADTLEELADYIGLDEEKKATFLASIAHYNEICASGVDTDFGKDPRLLFPIQTAPFYAHVSTPSVGSGLVTTGGFVTTNDQQVLDEDYNPIPGLYASGNTCGLRFGSSYITPISGVSIGIALTLGRLCGQHCAETL